MIHCLHHYALTLIVVDVGNTNSNWLGTVLVSWTCIRGLLTMEDQSSAAADLNFKSSNLEEESSKAQSFTRVAKHVKSLLHAIPSSHLSKHTRWDCGVKDRYMTLLCTGFKHTHTLKFIHTCLYFYFYFSFLYSTK